MRRQALDRTAPPPTALYASPRYVTSLAECCFYHTMDIPGHGHVDGQWDLRPGVQDYLGGVRFEGKRVLEVGTASGFLCFHMESQGADVVAFDLADHLSWDIVPFARRDPVRTDQAHRVHIRQIHNGYWLAHQACRSAARVVYGTVYDIPEAIGPVDIATFGCILLHLRDPFLALANALRLTRETVIVTEAAPLRHPLLHTLARWLRVPLTQAGARLTFLPDHRQGEPMHTWWQLSPQLLCRFLGVFGFEDTRVTHHEQIFQGQRVPLFTVVGRRTAGTVLQCCAA